MNKKVRRNFSASFKKEVALEALKEQETLSSLCTKFELHASQITDWKKQLISGAEQIFNGFKTDASQTSDDTLRDELYKQIGELTVENDWLKKKSEQIFGKGKQNGINR